MNLLSLVSRQLQQQNDFVYLPAYELTCGGAHELYYQYGMYRKTYTLDKVDNTFYLETSLGNLDITFSFTAEEEKLKATPNLPDVESDESFFHIAMVLLLPITINISIAPVSIMPKEV